MEYRCSVGEDWRNSVSAANPLIFINALGDRGDCVRIVQKLDWKKGLLGRFSWMKRASTDGWLPSSRPMSRAIAG